MSSPIVSGSCYSFSGKDSLTPSIEVVDLDISFLTSDSVGSPIFHTSPRPIDSSPTLVDSYDNVSPSPSSDSCVITPLELLLPTHPMVTRYKLRKDLYFQACPF